MSVLIFMAAAAELRLKAEQGGVLPLVPMERMVLWVLAAPILEAAAADIMAAAAAAREVYSLVTILSLAAAEALTPAQRVPM